MHSSISSFEGTEAAAAATHSMRRAVIALLAVVAGILASAELTARLEFDRISRIQRRMQNERSMAMTNLSHARSRQTVLLVGNSVVLEGIDFPALRQSLAPSVDTFRYVVELTTYYDWYYGLRRMFREGMRPTYVLIGFSAPHLNASTIRGDYAAYYLFDAAGVVDYTRAARLDLTAASSLLFAHYSSFYATRGEIRAFVMTRMFPEYGAALHNLGVKAAPQESDDEVARKAVDRLRALDELVRAYGSHLIVVIMPTNQFGESGLVAAGHATGTTVLCPLRRDRLRPDDYADGFHLNAHGRSSFTSALTEQLRTLLAAANSDDSPASLGHAAHTSLH